MALSENINTLEKQKFVEVGGNPAVRVSGDISVGSSVYTKRVDDVGGTILYVGEAAVGSSVSSAVWRIQKITQTGNDIDVIWAEGDSNFDKTWDDRLTYTYS